MIKILFMLKEIRGIVRDLEKSASDMSMKLQNIHNEEKDRDTLSMCV